MKLQQITRYYHTIKHLKAKQIAYLIKYRLEKYLPQKYTPKRFQLRQLVFDDYQLVPSTGKFHPPYGFTFLNRTKYFNSAIDWNFSSYGKLWNYNLQYFEYLLDPALPVDKGIQLILDFSQRLLQQHIALEPYPVSLRLVHWLLFYSKTGFTSEEFEKAISVQIQFLSTHQEHHIEANHLLENYIALMICSLYTGEEPVEGIKIKLETELQRQVLNDGAHYECSPMYHLTILSKLYVVYLLQQKNGIGSDDTKLLRNVIVKMTGWLLSFQYSNGDYPLMNDAAVGISTSSQVIQDTGKKYDFEIVPTALKDSGYRKWNLSFGELVIDAGDIKPSFQPGHAHSDHLSFTLFINGKELFIDPGVSTYEKNERRNLERSTAYHNTVTINNENQSDVWGGFRVGKRARICIEVDLPYQFTASHDGYLQKFKCIHKRSFAADKNLTITDTILWKKKKKNLAVARFYINGIVIESGSGEYLIDRSTRLSFVKHKSTSASMVTVPDGFNNYKEVCCIEISFTDELITQITQC